MRGSETGPVTTTVGRGLEMAAGTTMPPAERDEGLPELERARDGDPAGITALYDRYGPAVLALALRVVGDRTTAEDVVQETFVGVWKNAWRFDVGRGSARTWILSIAHHRAVDAVRRHRRIHVPLEPGEEPIDMPSAPDVWPEVVGRLDRAAIVEALTALPEAQRHCIELAFFDGLTHQEIAAVTETPLGTVKSRIRAGLLRLRRSLMTREQTVFADAPSWIGPPESSASWAQSTLSPG